MPHRPSYRVGSSARAPCASLRERALARAHTTQPHFPGHCVARFGESVRRHGQPRRAMSVFPAAAAAASAVTLVAAKDLSSSHVNPTAAAPRSFAPAPRAPSEERRTKHNYFRRNEMYSARPQGAIPSAATCLLSNGGGHKEGGKEGREMAKLLYHSSSSSPSSAALPSLPSP